jgi:hypothetical protein
MLLIPKTDESADLKQVLSDERDKNVSLAGDIEKTKTKLSEQEEKHEERTAIDGTSCDDEPFFY